jgi:hypothetical protein
MVMEIISLFQELILNPLDEVLNGFFLGKDLDEIVQQHDEAKGAQTNEVVLDMIRELVF